MLYRDLILALAGAEVDYVLIGGVAAAVRGAMRATYDLDIVYARTEYTWTELSMRWLRSSPISEALRLACPFPGTPPHCAEG